MCPALPAIANTAMAAPKGARMSSLTRAASSKIPVGIETQMRIQTERAVEEADRLVLLADARAGLTAQDLFVARELHRAGSPSSSQSTRRRGSIRAVAAADFHALGNGRGFCDLRQVTTRVR